jgi:ActR/RegA family two-component response regulator
MTGDIANLTETQSIGPDASLLLVDDDGPFLRRLARAMEARALLSTSLKALPKVSPRHASIHPNMPLSTCGFRMATGLM